MKPLVEINPTRLTGKQYWRSLDQAAATPEFQEWVTREFPEGYATVDGTNRRTLLKLMGASFGLAGLTACRRPVEKILPFSRASEGYIHGQPLHYASVATFNGTASGVIVTTIEGRPIKIEGNPKHPYSLGATNAHLQASLLSLYDPDRAKEVQHQGARSNWDEFAAWAKAEFDVTKQGDGSGLRIVSEKNASPTLASVRTDLSKRFPKALWVEYESVNLDAVRAGAALATGQSVEPHFVFDKADVVFALDCDFLGLDSASILPVKQFSKRRRVEHPGDKMNRLYVAEANYSLTGAMADHRLRVKVGDAGALALELAKEINVSGKELKVLGNAADKTGKFVTELAKDLAEHKGKSIVVAGPRQPAAVHALVFAINAALGNIGQTVVFTKPPSELTNSLEQVKQLVADLDAGKVKTLVLLGGNPVYTMPADLNFGAAVKKAAASVALTEEETETWLASEWRLPMAHALECWGDARALDGTASIQQPMIEPLYGGRSVLEVAALVAGREPATGYGLVNAFWTAQWPAAEREKRWKASLFDGIMAEAKAAAVSVPVDAKKALAAAAERIEPAREGLEAVFYPSHSAYDGRFANNAWMQEAPDPMTKVVWDNVALISKTTAGKLGLRDGDLVSLSKGQQKMDARLAGAWDRASGIAWRACAPRINSSSCLKWI
jgi:molybdopterin-containing oxidoreductase family iron-sulfur binding subunit